MHVFVTFQACFTVISRCAVFFACQNGVYNILKLGYLQINGAYIGVYQMVYN
jgi:hypothetical protein